MTELLSNLNALANIAPLVNIVQFTANVALATAIVVWAVIIWGAVRRDRRHLDHIAKQDKTIKSYINEIAYLNDRLENETTTVYLDNPDGSVYAGPINAKLALEALQSAREAEIDLKIRFADEFPEPDHADHAEN